MKRSKGTGLSTFAKYMKILRVSLTERLTYRGDFFLGTFLRFLPMVTTILLWTSVYQGTDKKEVSGFKYREMIAYLLLVHIGRMFSSMPGLAHQVARDVRDGNLKKYLIQPLDMIGWHLAYRIAHKIAYILTAIPPYTVLYLICYSYFDGFPSFVNFAAFCFSLFLSFLIGFFMEICMGCIGFWMLEVSSVLYIFMTITYFLSGHMFPLDLLPEGWAFFLKMLPFQYLAYFPTVIFLEKLQGWEMVQYLLIGMGWAFLFMVLSRYLYNKGLKRYSAYGG